MQSVGKRKFEGWQNLYWNRDTKVRKVEENDQDNQENNQENNQEEMV